jgi:hypothetical protein
MIIAANTIVQDGIVANDSVVRTIKYNPNLAVSVHSATCNRRVLKCSGNATPTVIFDCAIPNREIGTHTYTWGIIYSIVPAIHN